MNGHETRGSDTTRKWLIGCGIGCGSVILILTLLAVGGFFFVRNIVEGFRDTEAMMAELTDIYGPVREFCPDPGGAVEPGRIEAFLSAREEYKTIREDIGRSLDQLSAGKRMDEVEVKRPGNVLKMLRLGFGLIPQIADFFKARNEALLSAEMGMGEYIYLYSLIYYSWLDKPVEDGPDFQIMEDSDWQDFETSASDEVAEARRDRVRRRLNGQLLPMLRNQLDKLQASEVSRGSEDWGRRLAGEIQAMENDRFRLPWEDGLPETLEASLSPFRTRLEESYTAMTNPLEVALEQNRSSRGR